jgi:hypothetical protein
MIENFLGFHLARKSITLLFYPISHGTEAPQEGAQGTLSVAK